MVRWRFFIAPLALALWLTAPSPGVCQRSSKKSLRSDQMLTRASAKLDDLAIMNASQYEQEHFAATLGLSPESRNFRSILKGESQISEEQQAPSSDQTPLFHIKGTSKHRLSSFQELDLKLPFDREQAEQRAITLVQQRDQQIRQELQLPELKECHVHETQHLRRQNERRISVPEQEQLDFLFLSKSDQNLKIDWLYGSNTYAIIYDPERPTPYAFAALNLPVSCLPTRIRLTESAIYIHSGKDALKNYEPDATPTKPTKKKGASKRKSK